MPIIVEDGDREEDKQCKEMYCDDRSKCGGDGGPRLAERVEDTEDDQQDGDDYEEVYGIHVTAYVLLDVLRMMGMQKRGSISDSNHFCK